MKCTFCEIGCDIAEGSTGKCRMYTHEGGAIIERFPHSWMNMVPISIETMPLLHWRPRSKALQVSTLGCNFSCEGCISEILCTHVNTVAGSLRKAAPEKVIEKAIAEGCQSIAFCLNEPTVSLPSFRELARAAHAAGLKAGCSTNGYFTKEALLNLIPHLDFVNLGLKGASDARYRECGATGGAAPVFRNLGMLHAAGVHCEVSAMYIKGAENEMRTAVKRVADVSPEIPFQVMRFVPFGEADLTLEPTIREAEKLCSELSSTLTSVYLFNSPGTRWLDTVCPACRATVFSREFYGPMGAKTNTWPAVDGRCTTCGAEISIVGPTAMEGFDECGMLGGYRPTRALEMVHAILVCLGAAGKEDIVEIWKDVASEEFIGNLHDRIQTIDSYLDLISEIAARAGREEKGRELVSYIRKRVGIVAEGAGSAERPRVYYCMGTPLFALNAGRFETNLVECAGGNCVNRRIERTGKPGVTISEEEFMSFDPEIILISGLFASPVEDHRDYCKEHDLLADAVVHDRIYAITPGWDFGSPRWILGLMEMANYIQPGRFSFDIAHERNLFYRTFYGIDGAQIRPNRSFFSPSGGCVTDVR